MSFSLQGMAHYFQHKHTKRVFIFLSALSLLVTLGIAARCLYLHITAIPQYEKKLQKKCDEQVSAINAFLDLHQNKMGIMAKDELILAYMAGHGIDQKTIESHVKKKQELLGFKDLSLINNKGEIVYSTHKLLQGFNLNNEIFSQAPLFRSYFASSMTLTADFSDFLFSPVTKEPAFYITAPLINARKVLGSIGYQINEEQLNTITRDYLDLGTTGEIVLAVQTGTQAYFITPTRQDPSIRFTQKGLFSKSEMGTVQRAARGGKGTGIVDDYLGHTTLATWAFIPRVDWGIVVKIDLAEVLEQTNLYYKYLTFFSILTLVLGLFLLLVHFTSITNKLLRRYPFVTIFLYELKYPLFALLFLFSYLLLMSIYNFQKELSLAVENSQNKAIKEVEFGLNEIIHDIEKVRSIGDYIAQDLRTERLISEDIKKRIRREIVETEGVASITIAYAPYSYDKNTKLFAPSIAQLDNGHFHEQMIDELYDYSNKEEGLAKTAWYARAFDTQSPQWLNPSIDPQSKNLVVTYATPFYQARDPKTPAGVIAIAYKLSQIAAIVRTISVGATGHTFILSPEGTFLYSSTKEDLLENKTLLQLAQEEGNDGLAIIASDLTKKQVLLKHFFNKTTQSSSWIYAHPIALTGWTIATVFRDKEIGLSPTIMRHRTFSIIAYCTMTILMGLALLCYFFAGHGIKKFLNFSNLIFITSIISLWYMIYQTPEEDRSSNIVITDLSSVNKFIIKQKEEAIRKNEPIPIAIPCGIEIYSLEQTSPKRVSFSGYIWHRYHKSDHLGIQRAIRIPQATSFTVSNEIKITEGDWEIVGLDVTATIYHEHDYTYYPFDRHHIIIPLEHADITKNIILVPDLLGYKHINPRKLPGLDTTFGNAKYSTKATFFDFTPYQPNSDLGVRSYLQRTDQYRLAYNAILVDDILGPFIFFFLPLLVILISIFAVLMLEQSRTDPFTLIGPYTGLFFALVLLHRSLHEIAPASQTLYIEYSFFYTYIVIILLVIHTILAQRYSEEDFYEKTLASYFKNIFWPLQLSAWIITTFIIFY